MMPSTNLSPKKQTLKQSKGIATIAFIGIAYFSSLMLRCIF